MSDEAALFLLAMICCMFVATCECTRARVDELDPPSQAVELD